MSGRWDDGSGMEGTIRRLKLMRLLFVMLPFAYAMLVMGFYASGATDREALVRGLAFSIFLVIIMSSALAMGRVMGAMSNRGRPGWQTSLIILSFIAGSAISHWLLIEPLMGVVDWILFGGAMPHDGSAAMSLPNHIWQVSSI